MELLHDWVGVVGDGGRGGIGDDKSSGGFDGIGDAGGVGVNGSIGDAIALMVLVLMVLVLKRLS